MWKMLKGYAGVKASKKIGGSLKRMTSGSRGRRGRLTEKMSQLPLKKRNNRNTWMGIGGVLLGALAAGAAIWAMTSKSGRSRQSFARSGQAPGRSHIQMSSHPASQARLQTPRRYFGS